LQWAKHRIRVGLVAGASQDAAPIITTKVVAQRSHYAVAIRINTHTGGAYIQDGVSDLKIVEV
jgi:hypothetical protein